MNESIISSRPLLSVIVPVYNVEDYIEKCLDSILRQTYANFELLLVDDGSPDRCGEICDEYAARDQRIKVFHKPNGGMGSALNVGLANSKGEFIGYVDSDDWIDDDYFETLIAPFLAEGGEEIDIVIGQFAPPINSGFIEKTKALSDIFKQGRTFGVLWANVFRSKLFVDFKHNDEYKLLNDAFDVWVLFNRAEKFYCAPAFGYHYITRANSCTNAPNPARYIDGARAFHAMYSDAHARHLDQSVVERVTLRMLHSWLHAVRNLINGGAPFRDKLEKFYADENEFMLDEIKKLDNETLRRNMIDCFANGIDGVYRYYEARFDELRSIVERGGKIYIYGAGEVATFIAYMLDAKKIPCEAFVVSAGQPTKIAAGVPLIELPVKNIDRIERSARNAIVMGVSVDVMKIVLPKLVDDGIEKIFIL